MTAPGASVALSPRGFDLFVPAARHSAEDRSGGLSAADLISRLTGDTPPPSGGRRARRAEAPAAPVEEPTQTFPAQEPPAGLTGSFFTGGNVTGAFRAMTSGVTGTFPAVLRSPKTMVAAASVGALGASALLTGMPNPAEEIAQATGSFHLAAADDVLPTLTDEAPPTTGADVAAQATQVIPAIPPVGTDGSTAPALGSAMGALPQVLGHANTAQADVLAKAAEAEARAEALKKATAGASVVDVISGVTGLGGKALAAAQTKLGAPYSWGSSGPNAFDCSGLTSWAFKQAGITIPRTSAAQSTFGTAVARKDLQPGDLVFFYQPVSHVGIYIGNGKILHASTSGEPVKISDMDSFPYSGARRV
jgi:peptidoglycan DL-endopeptidase CwlO